MGYRIKKDALVSSKGRRAVLLVILLLIINLPYLFSTSVIAQTDSPQIAITPSSGMAGTTVIIEGMFFNPASKVTITIDGNLWTTAVAAKDGSFSVSAVVPDLQPGQKEVVANGGSTSIVAVINFTASTTFVVLAPPPPTNVPQPVIAVNPSSGVSGTKVTIKGSFFNPASSVNITIDGQNWTTAVAGRDGSFSVSAIVPRLIPGKKDVIAVSDKLSAYTVFEVTEILQADLAISSVDYRFEDNPLTLVLSIGIINIGRVLSPETVVEIMEQESSNLIDSSPVRVLNPDETATSITRYGISEEYGGRSYVLRAVVDPQGLIPEINEENNWRSFEIAIPPDASVPESSGIPSDTTLDSGSSVTVPPPAGDVMETTLSAPDQYELAGDQGGIPLYWIILPVVLVAAGVTALYMIRRPKLLVKVQHGEMDVQLIEPTDPVYKYEICVRPVLDKGNQFIEHKGSLIAGKRKGYDGK